MTRPIVYPRAIETAIAHIADILDEGTVLSARYTLSPRSLALLLLQKDPDCWQQLQTEPAQHQAITAAIAQAQAQLPEPLSLAIAQARHQHIQAIEKAALYDPARTQHSLGERLHRLTVWPLTGFPILLAILYFGVYKFVGEFGAGTLVDILETFFEQRINPVINHLAEQLLPWVALQDLVAHDYGILTLGVRYATAIVLPIVATYFLVFSLLEDSGYLPRLSLMLDQLFKMMGLSGRAVIPIVLGLGCDTMATMVTRTLETRRERLLATFLLALAVPCAAQWGLILGLLAQKPAALIVWGSFMVAVFIGMGYLLARILPGQAAGFYIEVPPLRFPKLKNIFTKTWVRVKWYFLEVLPLFIWASVFIWVGRLTGLFDLIVGGLQPVARALGLPTEAAPIFLYGFFRRDYGAAGLFDLQQQGTLSGNQLVVAAIVLTLFLPCIAQLQMMLKEQGARLTLAIVAFIFPFAFIMGYLVNSALNLMGVSL